MTTDTSEKADIARSHAQDAASTAQDRAGEVSAHAQDAAHQVVGTASQQAQTVKDETVRQARNLTSEASSQLNVQAKDQTQRLAGNLRSLGDELKGMAAGGQDGGTATELVHQAADQVHQLAGYLDGKEPSQIVSDVRGFASRRPGAFLAGAAILGVVAGRLGRGVKDAGSDDNPARTPAAPSTDRPSAQSVLLPDAPADGFSTSTYDYPAMDSATGALVRDPATVGDGAHL